MINISGDCLLLAALKEDLGVGGYKFWQQLRHDVVQQRTRTSVTGILKSQCRGTKIPQLWQRWGGVGVGIEK